LIDTIEGSNSKIKMILTQTLFNIRRRKKR